jgi:protein-S-isoprenylcysteine O-methyltransferase Ste14
MEKLELKIFPPIVCAIVAIAMLLGAYWNVGFEFPSNLQIVSASVIFWASVIIVATAVVAFRGSKTTVHPIRVDKTSSLVTDGIFSWSRNPMYFGMALALVAVAIFTGNYWTALGPLAFVAFITRFQIVPEERSLTKIFGQTYTDYCNRVRRWI